MKDVRVIMMTKNFTIVKNPLSKELKVACEIYKHQKNGSLVWTKKLVSSLKGKVAKKDVLTSIDALFDWSIIRAEYGKTEDGKEGRLLSISRESEAAIKEMYDHWWKE